MIDTDKINTAYSDALIRFAVIENHKRELDAIPAREELEHKYSFSPEHEARMEELFAGARRAKIRPLRFVQRIAAAIFIAVTLLFGALMTDSEVRAAVWNAVVEWFPQFTSFTFDTSGGGDTSEHQWRPTFIPHGYTEVGCEMVGEITYFDYTDADGNMLYFWYSNADISSAASDNERREYSLVLNDGIEYHTFKGNATVNSSIIWEIEGSVFTLTSVADFDELLKMAFSVEKIK